MPFITVIPESLSPPDRHALMLSIIIPRPIGFISTISPEGLPNLAPFSYFQAVASVPPTILYCPNRNRHGRAKHSLLNALSQGEFVAHTVTEDLAEKINFASGEFPDGVNEFEEAGFTPIPSEVVKPFRVAECPVAMECRVLKVIELSDGPLGGSIVIGEVVRFHIRDDILSFTDKAVNPPRLTEKPTKINPDLYRPISRLGGPSYGLLERTFDMPRPKMTEDGRHVVEGSWKVTRKAGE